MGSHHLTIDYEYDWGGRKKTSLAIEKCLSRVLDIFDSHSAKGTFFISTETLVDTSSYVLEIKNRGHEIASHGHDHNIPYDSLSLSQLEYQASKSKDLLESLIGEKIKGFRTPQFRKSKFTEEVLSKSGYLYDSSEVSVNLPGRYTQNQFANISLPEFPVSSLRGALPAGLKWINLFGGVGSFETSDQNVSMVYLHLFDLMSISDVLKNSSRDIGLLPKVFYTARFGSIWKNLNELAKDSKRVDQLIEIA